MVKTLRTSDDLIRAGLLPEDRCADAEAVAARYAIAITPEMATLAAAEPAVAAQFVPSAAELRVLPQEREDPIGDAAHTPVRGIVHRYPDRVLLKLTHVCPVYCRFCFRREMVGPGGHGALDDGDLDAALAYVAEREAIFEVIVTGGDPFILNARRIAGIGRRLAAIGHVKAVRWHTRVPVVQPAAITPALIDALKAAGKATYVALHANHAAEFTPDARAAVGRLVDAGIVMLSQSVLLRGVNDDADTLEALMRAFVAMGVRPYYLHHGDLAPGTGHFRTTFEDGLRLIGELRRRLSGIALPAYVIDIPGGFGKVPVEWARREGAGWVIPDRNGRLHRYP